MRILIYTLIIVKICLGFDIKSIKADFIQTINNQDETITYTGKITATRDSKVYWEYIKPSEKKIFINGDKITIYEPKLEQVTITKTNNINFIDIINEAKQEGDMLISNVDNEVFMVFLDNQNKPRKIEYTDNLDNKSEIVFNNVEVDIDIDEKVFKFNIPDGIDVIYE